MGNRLAITQQGQAVHRDPGLHSPQSKGTEHPSTSGTDTFTFVMDKHCVNRDKPVPLLQRLCAVARVLS